MLRNLFSLPCRLTSRPRRRQATRRRALADRLPWIEPLEGRLLLAVDVWTGADAPVVPVGGGSNGDNRWSDGLNWSLGVAPGRDDTVVFTETPLSYWGTPNSDWGSVDDIPFTGSMEVDNLWNGSIQVGYPNITTPWMTLTNLSFASGSLNIYAPLSVDYLNLSGGTINNYAATSMTLNGRSDGESGLWSGGTFNLNGSLINEGTFTLGSPTGSTTLPLNASGGAGPLINQGTIIQDGTSNLGLLGVTNLDNWGSYKFQGDGGAISTNYGGSVTNEASGTITNAAGAGNSVIGTAMYNIGTPDMSGTLDVEAGTLMLKPQHLVGYNGTFTGGTFNVAAGATLDLTGGLTSSSYTGTYTGSGAGKISLNSGTLVIGSGGATFNNFPAGLFQWSGGTIDVSNGNLTNTGSLTITGTQEDLYGGGSSNALINQGAIVQDGLSNLTLTVGSAAELQNQGSYTFQGDGTISEGTTQGCFGILTNEASGTIKKAGGTGTSTISCPWANTGGTIDVQTGTISLATPISAISVDGKNISTSTGGTFNVAADAVLDLTGGATAGLYTGTYTGSGAGKISLKSGTLVIGPGGATFNFPVGLFQWSGGTIGLGNGSLTNAGSLTITGDGTQEDLYCDSGYVNNALINQGAIIQDGLSNLTLTAFAVLDNHGSYTYKDDGTISGAGGPIFGVDGTFTNSGTITKAGGTVTSTISSQLANTGGTINVQSGTLSLAPAASIYGRATDYTSTGGTFNVAAGAVLDLSDTTYYPPVIGPGLYTGTYTGSGAGKISLKSGTLVIGPGGATFNFPVGLFQWSGGTIGLGNGSLTNAGSLTITGDGTQEDLYCDSGYVNNALINQGAIIQDGLSNLTLTAFAVLDNHGSYTYKDDGTISGAGGPIFGVDGTFTNSGTITKAGGTVTSTISSQLANTGGTINVQSGTLSLAPAASIYGRATDYTSTGGTFNVAAGAVLDLSDTTYYPPVIGPGLYTGTYTGSGDGTISLNSGTLVIGQGVRHVRLPARHVPVE